MKTKTRIRPPSVPVLGLLTSALCLLLAPAARAQIINDIDNDTTMVISQTALNATRSVITYNVADGAVLTINPTGPSTTAAPGFNVNLATAVLTIGPSGPDATGWTIFKGFATTQNSGVIQTNQPGATLNLANVTFDGNSSGASAGAIRNSGSGIINVTNAIFTSNSAGAAGGAIQVVGGTTTVASATFSTNIATTNGGAIGINTADALVILDQVTFTSNTALGTGAGGAIQNSGTLIITSATFTGNKAPGATANGGAIFTNNAASLTSATNVVFDGNSAGNNGGAIQANPGTLVLTNALFENNAAGNGGGAVQTNAASTLLLTSATFTNNYAITNGGALQNSGSSTATITGVLFDGNYALGNGGGMQNTGVATSATLASVTFQNNRANGSGGGFANVSNAVATLTDVDFKNNWAFGFGGALYDTGTSPTNVTTLRLTGTNGVTAYNYTGNFASGSVGVSSTDAIINNTPATAPNASAGGFYYQAYTAPGATMTFDIAGGVSLTIGAAAATDRAYDTIASANTTASIAKTGAGAMTLNANNSYYSGSFAINQGALLLGNAQASLGGIITVASGATLGGSGSFFTLNQDNTPGASSVTALAGSTIDIGVAGGATAAPGALTFTDLSFTGATLKFDLFGWDAASSSYASDQLFVLGTLDAASTGTIFISSFVSGTYDLGNLGALAGQLDITVAGGMSGRQTAHILPDGSGVDLLLITGADQSRSLLWTGAGPQIFGVSAGSWTDNAAVNEFAPGDKVTFDATAPATARAITIDPAGAGGVNVSEMDVSTPAATDAYTFSGSGGVTTGTRFIQPADTPAETLAADGKLHKTGPGTLTFANTAANNFEAGIEITGGVLAFNNAAQLGTLDTAAAGGANADRGITFADTGTLRANAPIANLSNAIIIADAVTAALDTNNNAVTYTGALALAPAATSGTFAKLGAGTLTLAADSSAYAGSTQVAAGTLLLGGTASVSSAKLGGAINVAAGAALAGNGAATGSVTIATGAALIAGATHNDPSVTAPATLAITGALTLANNATLKYDLYSAGQGDLITVGSLTLLGNATIDINTVGSGTYTLLTAAAGLATLNLAALNTTLNGGSLGSARTAGLYSLSADNLNLLLSIQTANLALTWTGAAGNTWDSLAANWTGGDTQFVSFDKVTFTDAASGAIAIDPAGVQTSDMVVNAAADYTFTGGYIATATNATGLATAPAGKLVKSGAGTLTFANASNRFIGGIEISGGVLAFSDAAQLNTLDATGGAGADHGITFVDTATLRANASIANLANAIIIANGKTAALDTAANAVTYTGALALAPAATSGTFAKLGAGTLTLAADNSAYAGSTQITAGTLLLDASASPGNAGILPATPATLGGPVTIASAATLAGNGVITGPVTAAAGSLIDIGASNAASGTLTLGGLTLDGATIKFDLFGYDAASSSYISDQLFVTSTAPSALAGTGTIFINTYIIGTYDLGNIGALANNLATVIGSGASGRQGASLLNDTATGDLLLIAGADQSRSLFWTGATSQIFDVSAGSWTTTDGSATNEFATGDKVTFDDTHATAAAARAVTIPALGVNASEMDVTGAADYTFTGSGAITTGTRFIAPAANPASTLAADGKLHKTGPGTLTFANTAANNFEAGIEITGGVLAFDNAAQLGTLDTAAAGGANADRGITFAGTGTLRANAPIANLANAITIANGVTAALDTNGNAVTYTGALTLAPAATSGAFAKIGAGTLTLASDNSAYAGSTQILAGALLLSPVGASLATPSDPSAKLGGNVIVAAGATFGGEGAANAVTLAANSTLQIQNTLAIASLAIAGDATLTGSGTLSGAATIAPGATATVSVDAGRQLTFTANPAASSSAAATAPAKAAASALSLADAAFTGNTGALAKTGAGTLALESGAALAVNSIALNQGILLMRGNTVSAATAFTIASGAELRATGAINTASLVNNGVIRVGNAADSTAAFGKLTLAGGAYTGNNGSVYLNAGIASGAVACDQFSLAGMTISGTTNLYINIVGGAFTAAQLESIAPLDITGATIAPGAIFATPEANGITVSDSPYLYAYSLANAGAGGSGGAGGAGGAGGGWYPIGYIPPVPAFLGVDAVSLLMGAAALDSANDHITSLRGRQHDPKTRLWMSGIFRQDKLSSPYYDGATARTNGAQVGADWGNALSDKDHSLAVGVCYDYVAATLDIPGRAANVAHSSVDSRANGLGVYFTLERDRWYAAGLYHRTLDEKHEVTATTLGTVETKGNGWSASLEGGYKILNGAARSKWKAELYGQWVYQTHAINSGNAWQGAGGRQQMAWADTEGRLYQYAPVNSSVLRAGARVWRDFALGKDTILRPYLRASYAYEQAADTSVNVLTLANNLQWQFDNDMGGAGGIVEAGAALELGDRFLLNAAARWYKVGKIESYNFNLGAGISW